MTQSFLLRASFKGFPAAAGPKGKPVPAAAAAAAAAHSDTVTQCQCSLAAAGASPAPQPAESTGCAAFQPLLSVSERGDGV